MTTPAVTKMSAKEVTRFIIGKEALFILDVRNEDAYQDWKIEGEGIVSINIPYYELLDEIEPALKQLPPEQPVLVVCAKEGSSQFVAEQLAEAGRKDVFYLEGGMKGWSEYLEPVKITDLSQGGELYQFVRMGKGCLSYMIISEGEAAIIDSARMTDAYQQLLADKGAVLTHVMDTHLHADHISGGRTLAAKYDAQYHLPPKDAEEVTFQYTKLVEGSNIVVGKEEIIVQPIYTPGHTIGSTSFIIDDQYLLSGDILFIESIGRPDLAGLAEDWVGDLRETLYARYKQLPEHLMVLPAHFASPSELGEDGRVAGQLGLLYQHNPGLHIHDEEEFRRTVTENLPPQPHAYQDIRKTNMGKLEPDEDTQREMEIGPNRCAVHDN